MASGDDYTTIWVPNSVMRERAKVASTTVASLEAVRGYLKPRYIEELPDGRRVAELHAIDLKRVADGYACGECLAWFDRQFDACPCCGHDLNPERDIVDHRPDYWLPYEGRTSDEVMRDTTF